MPDLNLIDEGGFDEAPVPVAPPAKKKISKSSSGGGGGGSGASAASWVCGVVCASVLMGISGRRV